MTLPPTERTPPRDDDDDDHDGGGRTPDASLAREAEQRYLTYALSVITSRALPDVRDGLKPVQRRILHAMLADLALRPDGRFRKSAAVVGEVLGKYHPHGDTAVYDAMVRMAQPFAMRHPLVSGQGNFGSPDGDAAAAMRYTEAKLAPIALELLAELGQETVGFRDNYDGTRREPVVLPSRYPNLLVNGSYGIAVGMATSIPPHNLREVIDACVALIDAGDEPLSTAKLLRYVKGPDFPTGAELMANRAQLREIYEYGHGSLKLRGTYTHQPGKRRGDDDRIVITSMPYTVERHVVVEKIAEAVVKKKLPMVLDVRDESTDEVRVVLDLKRGSDPHLVMAYVFKHTPLQTNVNFNLTCLVPVGGFGGDHAAPAANASAPHDDDALTTPARLGLAELLRHFLDFRLETVTRRLRYALRKLQERIHILEGFEIIFDALDQAIRIIRRSDGRADAATKLMGRFGLSDVQAGAVLDLRLYRLSKLEILAIRRELAEKRAEAKRIRGLLKSTAKRWALVRDELVQVKNEFGHKRATRIVAGVEEPEYGAEDFIVAEDATVILMTSGWLKRVGQVKDVNKTRMRDGDRVLAAVAGSTKSCVAFFSNQGACYVTRIHDVPASTGYGEPIQSLFKLGDGERIVSMLSFDPRRLEVLPSNPEATEPEPPYALAVTRRGYGLRFSLAGHAEPSTRAGRKFARPAKGDEVLTVLPLGSYQEDDYVMCASDDGHAIAVLAEDVSLLSGPGKGVLVIKLAPGVSLLGAELGHRDLDQITVSTRAGKVRHLTLRSLVGSRGGKGSAVVKRGGFAEYHQRPVETPRLDT
ncbi:MAG: DNA topoisomerase IV subunit A [Myxococcota bacterium]